ncbi:MAG: carboxyltransferase domain-containing protein [Phaeodactylibacter sp.]|nr:carboxyltransferase domain-containing protein [Phaeodactylibacter sp.]
MDECISIDRYSKYSDKVWLLQSEDSFALTVPKLDLAVQNRCHPLVEWIMGDGALMLEFSKPVSQLVVQDLMKLGSDLAVSGKSIEIPVVFDGPDLAEVARFFESTVEEYLKAFCAIEYTVGFMGFTPGFGYLTGGKLSSIPRRDTPRQRMVAGAVAVAAGYACIYPVASPGGWNWLGHTDKVIYDAQKAYTDQPEESFLFRPGDKVKFLAC